MVKKKYYLNTLTILVIAFSNINANINSSEKPLKIFFDSYGSLFRYVQTEINFVDIVRNPALAEIHILMNGTRTGGGGSEYTLTFVGRNGFLGVNDTLKHTFMSNVSEENRNRELIHLIKLGLVRYIARTPNNKYLSILFEKQFEKEIQKDKWDNWVFGIGLSGSFRAEEAKKRTHVATSFDIDRVSEESKFMTDIYISNDLEKYSSDEGSSTVHKRRRVINSLYVLSISDHFSAGFFTGFSNNTYTNIKSSYAISPAIEYNYFPYHEAVRRNFTFLYKMGYLYNDYYNTTIYFKDSESLIQQSLSIGYSLNETWGEARVYLTTSNFLHDFSKSKIQLWSWFNYRLTGGLGLNVRLETSYINDQLYLEQTGATLEEILFNQKSLATAYQYELSLGFHYTFGSIFNNVVNTRF